MTAIDQMTLDVNQRIEIAAAVGDSYQCLIRRLSQENSTPDNRAMPMVLEEWPGGRWYRDLGNQQGHLWGFVQVIKPPTLLEIHGPLFMSYAVAGHVQFRLTEVAEGTELSVRHQALGTISEDHRQGLMQGWESLLQGVKESAQAPS